ncbi:target of Nesh-SH3 isoform X2 [Hippocampus zosterae]|uniref:target of Nesh-SH3 isoform X2 n=1 Tax=Hippocampus zosterae TaxID=109293 RepID=UPI00223DA9C1|nr:target of Nesh-SH3 isoform X2 [Hippocampus zosterae]
MTRMQQRSSGFLVLFLVVLIAGIVLSGPSTPRRSRVRRQNMKVRINATGDTIVMKFVRPNTDTKLEGYILGYGSSMFSKQFIPLPENGKPYETEFDAEPKYLIAVQPIPTNDVKKHCTGKVELEKPLHLVIGSVTPTSVLLSWGTLLKTPYEGNIMNDCLEDGHYTVRYRERNRKWNYQTCPTSDTVIDHLKPNAVYEFGVQPSSKDKTGSWSKPVIHNISSGGVQEKVIRKIFKRPISPVKPLARGPQFPFAPRHVLHNKTQGRQPISHHIIPKTTLAPTTTTQQEPLSTSGSTAPATTKQPIGGELSKSVIPPFHKVPSVSNLQLPLDISDPAVSVPVHKQNGAQPPNRAPNPFNLQQPPTQSKPRPEQPQTGSQQKTHSHQLRFQPVPQHEPYPDLELHTITHNPFPTHYHQTSQPTPQAQPQSETRSTPKMQTKSISQTKPQHLSKPQTASQSEPQHLPKPQTKPQHLSKPQTPRQPESQQPPKPQTPSQSEPQHLPKPQTPSQTKPQHLPKPQTPSQTKPQHLPKPQTPSQTKPHLSKPETPSQSESQHLPKPQPPSQTKPQHLPKPQTPSQTKPQHLPKPQTPSQIKPQPLPKPQIPSQTRSQHLSKPQTPSQPEPQNLSKPQTPSQPEAHPSKSETPSQFEPQPLSKPQTTSQPEPHHLPKPQTPSQTKPQHQSKPQTPSQTKPQPLPKPQIPSQTKPQPLPKPQIPSQTKPRPLSKPQTTSQPEPQNLSKPQTPSQPEPHLSKSETPSQFEPQPLSKPQTTSQPEPHHLPKPQTPSQTKPQHQSKPQTPSQTKPQPLPEPQTPSQTKPQPLPKPQIPSQTKPRPLSKPQTTSQPEPQHLPKPQTPSQTKLQPLPKPQIPSQTKPQPLPKPQIPSQTMPQNLPKPETPSEPEAHLSKPQIPSQTKQRPLSKPQTTSQPEPQHLPKPQTPGQTKPQHLSKPQTTSQPEPQHHPITQITIKSAFEVHPKTSQTTKQHQPQRQQTQTMPCVLPKQPPHSLTEPQIKTQSELIVHFDTTVQPFTQQENSSEPWPSTIKQFKVQSTSQLRTTSLTPMTQPLLKRTARPKTHSQPKTQPAKPQNQSVTRHSKQPKPSARTQPHPLSDTLPHRKPVSQFQPTTKNLPQSKSQTEAIPAPKSQAEPQPGIEIQPWGTSHSGPIEVPPLQAVPTAPSPPEKGKPLPIPAPAADKPHSYNLGTTNRSAEAPRSSTISSAGRNSTFSRIRPPPHFPRNGVRSFSTSSHSSRTSGAHHRSNAIPKPAAWPKEKPVLRQSVPVNKRPNLVGMPNEHDKPMDLKQGDKESILKPFPLVTSKPKQERRQQTTTTTPSLNSSRFEVNENSSIFRPLPASDVDIMGKKRYVAPHVIYKTDKKPDEPCSITSSLTYFPDEEDSSDQNVTAAPRIPPSNLTVVTVEGCPSFVILDWQKTDNETREYEVVSTAKGPNGEEVSILTTTNQTHTAVENLKPESSYEFKVTPKNELGTGPSSDPVTFNTESADPRVSENVSGKDALWTQFPFKTDAYSECNGKQYVKRTWYRKFVGIQLCNSLRYKIYLSDSLNGKFYNIGDQSGYGEDHCQFVDSFLDGRTGTQLFADQLPSRPGYFRALRQEPVSFGEIGGKSHVTYVGWYECGTPIPGKWW